MTKYLVRLLKSTYMRDYNKLSHIFLHLCVDSTDEDQKADNAERNTFACSKGKQLIFLKNKKSSVDILASKIIIIM